MIITADLRDRAAKVINTSWLYSMHWGKNHKDRHWTMDAKHDCAKRIHEVEEELRNLKSIKKELEEICPQFYPETE